MEMTATKSAIKSCAARLSFGLLFKLVVSHFCR